MEEPSTEKLQVRNALTAFREATKDAASLTRRLSDAEKQLNQSIISAIEALLRGDTTAAAEHWAASLRAEDTHKKTMDEKVEQLGTYNLRRRRLLDARDAYAAVSFQ